MIYLIIKFKIRFQLRKKQYKKIINNTINMNPMMMNNQNMNMNPMMMGNQMMDINMMMNNQNMDMNLMMMNNQMMDISNPMMMNNQMMNMNNPMMMDMCNPINMNPMMMGNQMMDINMMMNNQMMNQANMMQNLNKDNSNNEGDDIWNLIFENQNDRQNHVVRISPQKLIKEAINQYRLLTMRNDKMKFIFNSKELFPEMKICQSGLKSNSRILVISTKNLQGA